MMIITDLKKSGFPLSVILVLLISLVLSKDADAQHKNRDAVYLKSGSVIIGNVIQNDSLGVIKISNVCGIWLYNIQDVDSVGVISNAQTSVLKQSGYYNLSSIGLMFGEGANGYHPFASLTTVNGWQFGQRVFTGIGLGYEFYEWGVMPVFADIKYFFHQDVVTPFVSFKAGYSFPLSESKNNSDFYTQYGQRYGGVLVNPEVGLLIPVGSSNAVLIGIGYQYQELSNNETQYNWYSYEKRVYTNYNRISLRLSFLIR
ncbi:MAG: hypothetical protein CVU14_08690 [Bacteroidetes bacterium HGW-Bacteroidetes-9]|nr:MAG: hypothetical protein CVU14_08690 [Bacteroidetes bacterium HGW-Bacteroidetes-9]